MSTQPRYHQIENLLDLAVRLQGSFQGVSLDDVAERYEVSRRTAVRMLEAVRRALGEHLFDVEIDLQGRKHWRLSQPLVSGLFRLGAEDFAALDAAVGLAKREGDDTLAGKIEDVVTKLRALSAPEWLRHLDPDLEALAQAQGFACRPGPRPRVDEKVLGEIRGALMAGRRIRVLYRKESGKPARWRTVGPLGLLYGNRHYLVATIASRRRPVLFRLSRIERVTAAEGFVATPDGFSLDSFARQSFGVFQEEPIETLWRFDASVAEEAAEYCFHPDQESECGKDGALLVRFRAGGRLEMAWHLFTWGRHVEVLEPASLRAELTQLLEQALRRHGRAPVRRRRAARRAVGG